MNQDNFIIRLKETLQNKNIKQAQLARESGITPSSISDWLKGKYFPKQDKINKLAEILNVNPMWLAGQEISSNKNITSDVDFSDESFYPEINKIPLIGEICAGDGIFAEENLEDYIYINDVNNADFALTVQGDSMIEAGIFDGDIVFIKKKPIVNNGRIAAVLLLDSNEASLKKFYKKEDHILLQPCNSFYEPIITKDVLVIGECVGVFRKL